MVFVNADLHIHTSEDREDTYIKHSTRKLVDAAADRKIGVVAITLHNYVLPVKSLKSYGKKKGVLVIQGVEATIEGKHVLIYNISPGEFKRIKSFEDLRELKKRNKNIFVAAPHPFMPKTFLTGNCLNEKYFENRDLFDALEFQQFYFFLFNPNKKVKMIANEDKKPVIANSDSHFLRLFGTHYSVVDVKGEINEKNFFDAVKKNRVKIFTKMNFFKFADLLFSFIFKV